MKYRTSYLATGGYSNKQGIMGVGSRQYFVDKEAYSKSLKLLNYLLKERTEEEIKNFCQNNNIPSEILNQLITHNLVSDEQNYFEKIDNLNFKNKLYFNALGLNANYVTENFKNTTFIIVGCGGIGNFISFSLSSLSPKKIELVDGDKIEKSNLNRQFLFTDKDIGKYKVSVLKNALIQRNPSLSIEEHKNYVSFKTLQDIVSHNNHNNIFIVLSGDSFSALNITTRYCVQNHIPFINIGYLNDISAIGPFYIPNISSCPFCNNSLSINDELSNEDKEISEMESRINKNNEAPSSFTNNAMSSSMGMSDIIKYMAHDYEKINSLNKRIGIDTANFKEYVINVPKDERCEICGNGEQK